VGTIIRFIAKIKIIYFFSNIFAQRIEAFIIWEETQFVEDIGITLDYPCWWVKKREIEQKYLTYLNVYKTTGSPFFLLV